MEVVVDSQLPTYHGDRADGRPATNPSTLSLGDPVANRQGMGEKESYDTATEARRDVAAHPERPPAHEEAISRYLGSAAYRVAHHRNASEHAAPDDAEKET